MLKREFRGRPVKRTKTDRKREFITVSFSDHEPNKRADRVTVTLNEYLAEVQPPPPVGRQYN